MPADIVFSLTDDQDVELGGWNPMKQTQELLQKSGGLLKNWRIHTPICSPSRSETVSGRYFHNIQSNVTTPGPKVTGGAVGHVDLGGKVWPYVFSKTLRKEKGYVAGMFGKCMNMECGNNPFAGGKNLHNEGAFDAWFEGTSYQDGTPV